jgi:hypothetical protein
VVVISGMNTASMLEQMFWSTVDPYRRMLTRDKFKWSRPLKCFGNDTTVHTQAGDIFLGRIDVKSVIISSHAISTSVDNVKFRLATDAG